MTDEKDIASSFPEGMSTLEEVRLFMQFIPFNKFLGLEVDELGDGYAINASAR